MREELLNDVFEVLKEKFESNFCMGVDCKECAFSAESEDNTKSICYLLIAIVGSEAYKGWKSE